MMSKLSFLIILISNSVLFARQADTPEIEAGKIGASVGIRIRFAEDRKNEAVKNPKELCLSRINSQLTNKNNLNQYKQTAIEKCLEAYSKRGI